MDDVVARSAAQRRFALIVFEAFALAALVLASIGIYGVLSGGVAERTRELGVRSALGATPGDIVGVVVRRGLGLTGLGVLIGLAGAAAASRTLVTLLFGITPLDPDDVWRRRGVVARGRGGRLHHSGSASRAGRSGDYAESGIANVAPSRRARA